jgi:hypothetical protein
VGDDASSVAVFMNRILLIDVGNSRLKWGVHESQGWTEFGATPNSEVGTLAVRDWQNLPRPERIAGVNVAGEAMRNAHRSADDALARDTRNGWSRARLPEALRIAMQSRSNWARIDGPRSLPLGNASSPPSLSLRRRWSSTLERP